MSSSFSWEEMRQRRMKIYNNTPVKGACKVYVISDSLINTNSSRNISRRRINGSLKKKREPKKHVSSDSDWLTTEELTDNEKENLEQSVRSPTKGLALFEDAASPELVREDHDYHFDSPVRQRRNYDLSPVRVNLGDGEKTLPVKDILHLRTVFDSSDEEEELLLRKSDPVRTYAVVAHGRKNTTAIDMLLDEYAREHPEKMRDYISKSNDSNKSDKGEVTKKEDWCTKKILIDLDDPNHKCIVHGHCDRISRKDVTETIVKEDPYEFPEAKNAEVEICSTGDSDLQRAGPSCSKNERATENVKNTKINDKGKLQKSKLVRIASPALLQRYSDLCSHAPRKYNVHPYESPEREDAEVEICEVTKKEDWLNKKILIDLDDPNHKCIVHGHCDRISRKDVTETIVKEDPYEFPEAKNAEVEICSTEDSDLHRACPSCSKNERITENVKDTKIKEKEKLQKSKPVESASSTQLQKYSNLCSYATRLKPNGQEMLSENVAKNSNEESVSAQRTTRKTASEVNKDVSKRENIAVNIPTIRSVKNLNGIRYVKEKYNWRIIYEA